MKIILTFLFLISFVFAEDIKLTGKIVDQNNAPIEGIEVELKSNGLKGVTNSDGEWEIIGTASSVDAQILLDAFQYQLLGSKLLLAQNAEGPVQVQIVDASGKTHLFQKLNFSGEKSLDLQALSKDVFYVHIQTPKEYYNFQLILNQQQNKLVANPKALAASKISDSLVYKLQGQIFSEDEITEYQDHINKYLKVRDVTGSIKVDPNNRTTIKKVYAHFSGGKMKEPVVLELGWLSQTNKFSGQIYSVKPPAGASYDYQIFVYGVDSLDHKTSQTIILDFNSMVGPLELPEITAGNALPYGDVVSPDGHAINGGYIDQTLELFADVKDSIQGKVVKYEWDLGTGTYSEGTANASMEKDQMGQYVVRMRATDDDGNILEITKNIGFNAFNFNTLIDARDNKEYAVTTIGSLTWMAENLAYLPKVDAVTQGSELEGMSDSLFYYVGDFLPQGGDEAVQIAAAKESEYYLKYGVLYNWNAAKEACPMGWRVPSDEDWESLMQTLAAEIDSVRKVNNSWWYVNTLKSKSWGGSDTYGFNALPGGVRRDRTPGSFDWIDYIGYWWGSTEFLTTKLNAWHIDNDNFYQTPDGKNFGFSVRCVSEAVQKYLRLEQKIIKLESNAENLYEVFVADFQKFGDSVIDVSTMKNEWKLNDGEWQNSNKGVDTLEVSKLLFGDHELVLKTSLKDTVLYDTLSFTIENTNNFYRIYTMSNFGGDNVLDAGDTVKMLLRSTLEENLISFDVSYFDETKIGSFLEDTLQFVIRSGSDKQLVIEVSDSYQNKFKDTVDINNGGFFTDSRDDQIYIWVQIGTQRWMSENLAYLPQVDAVTDGSEGSGNDSDKFYYVYGYTPSGATEAEEIANAKATTNYQNYGVLYNWNASLVACPVGWHLPSDAEWDILLNSVIANSAATSSDDAGKYLKANSDLWKTYSGISNVDQFSFAGLPGGYRNESGYFDDKGTLGYWWSSTERLDPDAYIRYLNYSIAPLLRYNSLKQIGVAVRCIMD